MSYPSIKTLSRILDPARARIARRVLDGSLNPSTFDSVEQWERSLYSAPFGYERKMMALNELLGGFGVEGFQVDGAGINDWYTYVNVGDTYDGTIVRTPEGRYLVTSYGDVIESLERRGIIVA